jgi:hypothetical protein
MLERPMGSGYSMLFAKHLAYGCLPFGLDIYDGMSGWDTLTIAVNGNIPEAIQTGKHLDFTKPRDEFTTKAMDTLDRMPSSTFSNICCVPDIKVDINRTGAMTIAGENNSTPWSDR